MPSLKWGAWGELHHNQEMVVGAWSTAGRGSGIVKSSQEPLMVGW